MMRAKPPSGGAKRSERSPGARPWWRRRRWWIIGVAAAVLGGAAGFWFAGFLPPRPSLPGLEQSRLRHQAAVLRTYAAREDRGSFLPPADAAIALREEFLQRFLELSLPFHQEFEDGRYLVRVDSVRVRLEDGLAVARLEGRGVLAADTTLHAELLLQGVLTIRDVDRDTGTLRPAIEITDVRVRRAGPRSLGGLLNPVVRYFGRVQASDFNRLSRGFLLPLHVDRRVRLPEVRGDVDLPETSVPLSLRVSAVTVLDRRMVVSLSLLPDTSASAPEPVTERSWDPQREVREDRSWLPWSRSRVDTRQLAELRSQARRLAERDTLWRALCASEADVTGLLPKPLIRTLVTRVWSRYLGRVRVDLEPELTAEVVEELKTSVLGKEVGAGKVYVDIDVRRLRGRLTTNGEPRLELVPPTTIRIDAPARLESGQGVAGFHMKWDPALLVGVVCRGFETRETLAGSIVPMTHTLTTRIPISIEGARFLGRPRTARDHVRLRVDLTPASWRRVRAALDEQDRFGRCGLVMNADTVEAKLRRLAARGFRIRLPGDLFPDFEVPVAVATRAEREGVTVQARTYRPDVFVRPGYLWFAFHADLRLESAPPEAAAGPGPPRAADTPVLTAPAPN